MVWQRRISIRAGIEPNFVAASGLAVEHETARPQFASDLSVAESRQTAHLCSDHNGVVSPFAGGWQIRNAVTLTPRFD